MNQKVIPNAQFFSMVDRIIGSGESVEIKVRGSSMRPTLENDRHRVVLVPCKEEYLRIGAIALVRYNGKHILHRLVAIDGDTLVFRGDNLPHTSERVERGDVVAFAVSIIGPRGGVTDCTGWRFVLSSRLRVLMGGAGAVRRRIGGVASRLHSGTDSRKDHGEEN